MNSRGRGSASGFRAAAVAATALVLAIPAPVTAGSPGDPAVTLAASASFVAQGAPFDFTATLRNPGPSSLTGTVWFQLSPPGPGDPVFFQSWSVSVPPGGTQKADRREVSAQWFPDLGTFAVTAWLRGGLISNVLSYEVTAPGVDVPRFEDVTAAAGISTNLPGPGCGEWEAGAAWGDANGDGHPDLYVPNRAGPAQLWMNDGTGHFTDQAAARGVDDFGYAGVGAVFADYDNDGHEDLYVVNDGPNRLFHNDGTGHFVDVAQASGVADPSVGPSAAWGDYDNDGYLDLYVANHVPCSLTPQQDRLYHNDGDGTFTDVTDLLPVASTMGSGLAVAWFDYNGDGRQDLYLGNDHFGLQPDPNHLWRNDGPGLGGTWRFTDVSASSGTGYSMHSMGIGIGDYNRDGLLDMAISNVMATKLATNQGDGTFVDQAKRAGVDRPRQDAEHISVTWGLSFVDLNLDGWEDLPVTSGGPYGPPPLSNELFANAGGGRFLDLSAPSGTAALASSRGLAAADYDGDGAVDLFVVNVGSPSVLLRNITQAPGAHWLEVRTTGTFSNADGCGALLTLTIGSHSQVREVLCGSGGLASGNDRTVHFGLGPASVVSKLVIDWSSGFRQELTSLPADQILHVTEQASRGPDAAEPSDRTAARSRRMMGSA